MCLTSNKDPKLVVQIKVYLKFHQRDVAEEVIWDYQVQ